MKPSPTANPAPPAPPRQIPEQPAPPPAKTQAAIPSPAAALPPPAPVEAAPLPPPAPAVPGTATGEAPLIAPNLPAVSENRIVLIPPMSAPPMAQGAAPVALLLPLSGSSASVGQALLNAAQLAVFDMAPDSFALLPIDTRGTPEGAVEAIARASAQGARLVLGPLFAGEVRAATPAARAAGIRLVAFTTDRSAASPGAYQIGIPPRAQVERVVAFARERGIERFAALTPNDEVGRVMMEAFRTAVETHGGLLVESHAYDPQTADFNALIKKLAHYDQRHKALLDLRKEYEKIKDADESAKAQLKKLESQDTIGEPPYEALFLADRGGRLKNIAALLPYYDIDSPQVRLLGTMLWEDERQLANEPAMVGAWYAAPPPAARAAFEQAYQKHFGQKPPRIAAAGYDATALAAVLARQGGFGDAALTVGNGFAGIDGIFRLLPDGTSQRGLAVIEIAKSGPKIISPAPASFVP